MFFQPSRDEVRLFFTETWRKMQAREPLTPIESMASEWLAHHSEFHELLSHPERARDAEFSVEDGRTNPFLHLAMHLSIAEQISIDQPAGIRSVMDALTIKTGDLHEAMHQAMDCLAEMLWTAQRHATAPDPQGYLNCLRRRARGLN
ncbi:MAG: DUF1841 family protein [Betaproteobacteria bacterium]|nr:DUF1841 family protein [Betaproteobacteria bacterium]NCA15872.1 DUF1841 family protein [Betaproteobacteria bacterium]